MIGKRVYDLYRHRERQIAIFRSNQASRTVDQPVGSQDKISAAGDDILIIEIA
nr:hypothetical protein [Asaia bogorensis]